MGLIFYSFLIFKPFAKNSLANIKLSKTQLPKLVQSGEILGRLIRPLLKTGLPLMKNLLNVLIPLEFKKAASAAGVEIQKNSRYRNHNIDT